MTDSPRKFMMDTLRKYAEQVRGGRYFVKRGAMNWAAFSFQQHGFGIALLIDDMSFMKSPFNNGKVSIEMFGPMPDNDSPPEIDDGLLDDMAEDVRWIVERLEQERDDSDNPVVFRLDRETARIIEAHDADLRVQGVIAIFNVDF